MLQYHGNRTDNFSIPNVICILTALIQDRQDHSGRSGNRQHPIHQEVRADPAYVLWYHVPGTLEMLCQSNSSSCPCWIWYWWSQTVHSTYRQSIAMILSQHYHYLAMYKEALEGDRLSVPASCHACTWTATLTDIHKASWKIAQKSSAEPCSFWIESSSFLNPWMSISLSLTGSSMGYCLVPDHHQPFELSVLHHQSLLEGALPLFPSLLPIVSYYKLASWMSLQINKYRQILTYQTRCECQAII